MKKNLTCDIYRPRIVQQLDKNRSHHDEVYFSVVDVAGVRYFGFRDKWDGNKHVVKSIEKQIHQDHYRIKDDNKWFLIQKEDESWQVEYQGDILEIDNLKVVYILAGTNYAVDTIIYQRKKHSKNFQNEA